MKIIFRSGRKARPGVAYMVTSGIYDDYAVICVCADLATARNRASGYNRHHKPVSEDYRARVEEVTFIPAATATT